MREIMTLVGERKAALARHPFLVHWLGNDEIPIREKFLFAPIMTNFVMNFRDMNKWFIRFVEPKNTFEEIINGNTFEDETHSRLFLEDWKKLSLDEELGWRASDTIWWLFLAEETEAFRNFGMRFSRISVEDGGDALVRFAHSEAGEACGNCFFDVGAPQAALLTADTGISYRYFGHFHLDREQGHVIESEGVFEHQPLDEAQRAKALELANQMFDIFFEMFDCFHAYAREYVARGRTPHRLRVHPLLPSLGRVEGATAPAAPHSAGVPSELIGLAPEPLRAPPKVLPPRQAEVQRVLEARKAETANHPFYAWLRADGPISPKNKLRRFMPMWVMDIMGYRDLNHYVLRYPVAKTDGERAINRWVDSLSTHSVLFLNDWDALEMDDLVGWNAVETLRFLFLDRQMDVHRENAATFIKLAMRHPQPIRRFWMMEALEASGEAFFQNTRVLAHRIEATSHVRLDYFGDRHDVVHPVGEGDPKAAALAFKGEPMSDEDRDVAITMVHTVFNAVDTQLSLSLDVARANRFNVPDAPNIKVPMKRKLPL